MLDDTFDDEAGKSLRDLPARDGPEPVRLIDSRRPVAATSAA
jgi:hypothetical protein